MKPTTINVQITKSPRQFEAVRIGMEATLDPSETVESAVKAATEQLNAIYAEMYTQPAKVAQTAQNAPANGTETKPEKPSQKERLVFGDKRVQQIVARIEKDPKNAKETIKKAKDWYEMDEKVLATLELAAKVA
jgi:hypothetical protein